MELDGINLSLRGNDIESPYTNEFIKEISSYIKQKTSRRYMLTASPVCHSQAKDIFKFNYLSFDRYFIDFTSVSRCIPDIRWIFRDVWFKYLKTHPRLEIWFIFSASPNAFEHYVNRKDVTAMIKVDIFISNNHLLLHNNYFTFLLLRRYKLT